MGTPFIFIGTHKVRDGRLEAFKKECLRVSELAEVHEPRLIGIDFYVHEDTAEVSVVQVHPDPDSMLLHMQLLQERIGHAYEEDLEGTTGIQIFGTPNDAVLQMIKQLAGAGVPVTVQSPFGGFNRFPVT